MPGDYRRVISRARKKFTQAMLNEMHLLFLVEPRVSVDPANAQEIEWRFASSNHHHCGASGRRIRLYEGTDGCRLKDNHVPLPGRSIFSNTEGDSRWTMDRSTAIDAPMDSAGGGLNGQACKSRS